VSFRARLTIAAALAVAAAVALASLLTYVVVRDQLRGEVDDALRARADDVRHIPRLNLIPVSPGKFLVDIPGPKLGGAAGYIQLVPVSGEPARSEHDPVALPVSSRVRSIAAGQGDEFLADAEVSDTHMRVLSTALVPGWALQVARPLTEVDSSLSRIRKLLFLITFAGVGFALALGLGVTRTVLVPVRRLTETAEHVTETRDLKSRIDTPGRDELGRLASTFNTMLGALEDSARAQRQLVADASHELRTPLTSLRTNIEVLARHELPVEERERVLGEVVEQLTEMTALIAELVELARGDAQPLEPEDVRLDLLVADAVARAQRHAPDVDFRVEAEESLVHGVPSRIERAVGNLLDNAGKWSPSGSVVEVTVRDGEVTVRDRGPGIADEDLPFVFDRFYRAPSARGMPGSGLGLSIVQQVAQAHGGVVTAERAEGGGAVMRFRLPVTS
jgi:two-component system sensor histidine kinase MprB